MDDGKLMEIEAEQKVGAKKHEHNSNRKSYFSGYRPRRFDTRLGTIYLMVPKIKKGVTYHFLLQRSVGVNKHLFQ